MFEAIISTNRMEHYMPAYPFSLSLYPPLSLLQTKILSFKALSLSVQPQSDITTFSSWWPVLLVHKYTSTENITFASLSLLSSIVVFHMVAIPCSDAPYKNSGQFYGFLA